MQIMRQWQRVISVFKNKYDEECYLAVSEEITDWQELPEVFPV